MATIDTLASLHSVPRSNLLVLIIENLTPNTAYNIYRMSSDTIQEDSFCALTDPVLVDRYATPSDLQAYWSNPTTSDANGRIIKFFTNFVADDSVNTNGGLTIHDNVDPGVGTVAWKTSDECARPPDDRRLDKNFLFSTTNPIAPLDPWYVTVDNLVATPGTGEVDLAWNAGTKLDAGRGSIEYQVLRRNSAGDPNIAQDVLVSGLTTTSYTDTTPAVGVTYKYRVAARLYWDGFLPYSGSSDVLGYLPYDSFWGGLDLSNIEIVTLGEVAAFTVSMNVRIPMRAPA